MCAAVSDIHHFAQISDLARRIIESFMPGP
jgi:tRNA A37 threonylcarbamoyladenosine synthetase subunit TsaC/SUA5/YrdC